MKSRVTDTPYLLSFMAVFFALLAFLALLDLSYVAAGGVFEYPLDDPYIHMAMAEQMRAGMASIRANMLMLHLRRFLPFCYCLLRGNLCSACCRYSGISLD